MTICLGDGFFFDADVNRGYLKIIGFPVFGKMDIAKAKAWGV